MWFKAILDNWQPNVIQDDHWPRFASVSVWEETFGRGCWSSCLSTCTLVDNVHRTMDSTGDNANFKKNGLNCEIVRDLPGKVFEVGTTLQLQCGGYSPSKSVSPPSLLPPSHLPPLPPLTNQCHHVTPLSAPSFIVSTYMPYKQRGWQTVDGGLQKRASLFCENESIFSNCIHLKRHKNILIGI